MTAFKRGNTSSGSKFSGGGSSAPARQTGGTPNAGGPQKGKSNFSSLGSLTVPKSANDELREVIMSDLRGSDVKLNCKVYLPKGVNSVTLNRDDVLLVTFMVNEKDPDFVVGKLLLSNNE